MRRLFGICGAIVFLVLTGFGQSLGDAARELLAQKKSPVTSKHVYTNDDFAPAAVSAEDVVKESKQGDLPSAMDEQERDKNILSDIRRQKARNSTLDARIREVKRRLKEREALGTELSVNQRVLTPSGGMGNGTWYPGVCEASKATYYDPYKRWCEEGARLESELDQREAELENGRAVLEELQERARRMGYRSVAYDPD